MSRATHTLQFYGQLTIRNQSLLTCEGEIISTVGTSSRAMQPSPRRRNHVEKKLIILLDPVFNQLIYVNDTFVLFANWQLSKNNPNHHGTRFALDVIARHVGVQVVLIKLFKLQGNARSSLFEGVKSCTLV